jgi:hypothetical protein
MSICTMQQYKDSFQSSDSANVIGKIQHTTINGLKCI